MKSEKTSNFYKELMFLIGGWDSEIKNAKTTLKHISESSKEIESLEQIVDNLINEVVTVQEAAEITNLNVRQVQRLCEKGKYKCRKAKGTWLILRSSL